MLRDLRIAVRTLRSWRFGAVAAVLTLAVGIGTTTSVYALLRAMLAGTVPQIEDVDRVARIYASNPSAGVERLPMTLDDFSDSVSRARTFESIATSTGTRMRVGGASDESTLSVTHVTASFFSVLRAQPAAGRLFTPADFALSEHVAVISEPVWKNRFERRPLSDGLAITLDGTERRVIGVLPASFDFSFIGIGADVWLPLTNETAQSDARVVAIARLGRDQTWASASAELAALTPAALRAVSAQWRAIPILQDSRHRTVGATAMTLVPAVVILVIGCVNVACMLLARGVARNAELSVRCALGASRAAIFRQLLLENVTLAVVAGSIGAAIAVGMIKAALAVIGPLKPSLAAHFAGDLSLLPIAVGASCVACLLFGMWPALRLSRRDVATFLKGAAAPGRVRVAGYGARDLIVFLEVGVAVVLVTLTAMWFSVFSTLQNATAAFPADQLLMHDVARDNLANAIERVRSVAGVEGTTVAAQLPAGGLEGRTMLRTDSGAVARARVIGVGERFFETMGLAIVRGRAFDRTETGPGANVAVVSASVAAALWPGADPLGKELLTGDVAAAPRVTVIGVCRNTLDFRGVGLMSAGDVYRPLSEKTSRVVLLARVRHARTAVRPVAAALRASPSAPLPEVRVVADAMEFPREPVRIIRLFGAFALIALLLAASGIFAVINQSVALRTTEFGVRMALGASAKQVLVMVLAREVKLIAAALAVGAVGTVAATRVMFAELVWLSARNPGWPIGWSAVCGSLACVALGFATYRILKLEPADVLRKI